VERRRRESGELPRITEEGERSLVGELGIVHWWDKSDPDEEEEGELHRGRKKGSEILNVLESGHALSSTDVTIRDDSSICGKQYNSGVTSENGSRSVSVSGATSPTKRDSGSVA